ncbi:ureide permease 2-like isoform X2 [Quercus lobata]|uniref:ureide permease 2-like isoform X2 n=1 Tax=Quercus lobata TaxID=97700 RepID=UPI001244F3DD|nr:ureide permease 2-like isoform X2 [Quercus lobata]
MYVVESKGGAIVCMLLALLFLGTWPAVMTLLERRGRLPQHTYLDYSITNLLAAVIIALTFGEIGKGTPTAPNFFTQLSQDNWPSVLFAMAGGVVLSVGNLSTQYSWALVGLSVTEVISSSLTVVIGTTMNYFLDDKINRADILFPGVGCFLIAVCLGSFVHASNAADNKEKLKSLSTEGTGFSTSKETLTNDVRESDVENGSSSADKARAGTAGFLIELENRRSIKAYLSDWNGRGWAFLAGFLCGFGNGLQFMGGEAAGYAAADAVQALPLVSTFWGILIFGEYRRSSRKTYILLVSMLFMFVVAVGVLMASSGHRK